MDVSDLDADRVVTLQSYAYPVLAPLFGLAVPAALGEFPVLWSLASSLAPIGGRSRPSLTTSSQTQDICSSMTGAPVCWLAGSCEFVCSFTHIR